MIEHFVVREEARNVVRLASVVGPSTRDALKAFGIDPEAEEDIIALLSLLGMSLSPEDIVDDSFRPRSGVSGRFGEGRFSDGSFGVYYSALDEITCRMELRYHLSKGVAEHSIVASRYERVYSLIHCKYQGRTADLLGKEEDHPQLVSDAEDGYPFCQALALEAVEHDIAGFLAPSARHDGGTCVPIFFRTALSEPEIRTRVRATVSAGDVTFHLGA